MTVYDSVNSPTQESELLYRFSQISRSVLSYALLIAFAFITIFPFVWMLSTSFKSQQAIFSLPPELIPDLLGKEGMWDNYTEILTKHNFVRYTFNSFFVATSAALGQVVTSSLAGFAFARLKFRGKNIIFAILLSTALIPVEVSIIPEFLLGAKVFDPLLSFHRRLDGYLCAAHYPLFHGGNFRHILNA